MNNIPPDVQKLIDAQLPKFIRNKSEEKMREDLRLLKSQLILEFLGHPVTVEIMAGPTSANTSGTLGGYGNLFSFIGFEKEEDPIAPILKIFEAIDFSFRKEINSGNEFNVTFPLAQDIFNVTPMPWAQGRSWAKGVETGISGLGYYIFRKNLHSRSEQGTQTSVKLKNSVKFSNTSYISELLNKYRARFLKIT